MNGAEAYTRGEERPNAGCPLKRRRMEPTSVMQGSRQQHQTGKGAGSRIRPFSPVIHGFLHIRHRTAPYPRASFDSSSCSRLYLQVVLCVPTRVATFPCSRMLLRSNSAQCASHWSLSFVTCSHVSHYLLYITPLLICLLVYLGPMANWRSLEGGDAYV